MMWKKIGNFMKADALELRWELYFGINIIQFGYGRKKPEKIR